MGLDMYLWAGTSVANYARGSERQKKAYQTILNALALSDEDVSNDFPSIHLDIKVGYWRKANAVHNWFVTNVQNGEDDCKMHYVDREQLAELVMLCDKVLAQPDTAPELLPATSGLFFGSEYYDEYYLEQLEDTVEMISDILQNPNLDDYDFHYQSSW